MILLGGFTQIIIACLRNYQVMIGKLEPLTRHAEGIVYLTKPIYQIFACLALTDGKSLQSLVFMLLFSQFADIAPIDNMISDRYFGNLF